MSNIAQIEKFYCWNQYMYQFGFYLQRLIQIRKLENYKPIQFTKFLGLILGET